MIIIHLGIAITVNSVRFVAYGSRRKLHTENVTGSTQSIVLNANTRRATIATPSTQESKHCVRIIQASKVISLIVVGIADIQLARKPRKLISDSVVEA